MPAHFRIENRLVSQPVLDIKELHKSFRNLKALNGVDLTVHKGEYVALLGPNGAGKTTLLEIVEGIQKPDKGTIHLFGTSWHENKKELRHKIGLSFQDTRFVDRLTVMETILLFASFYKVPKKKAAEVLEKVKLTEKANAFVPSLSGGQRQRLALAIALVHSPEILLLDEPTTGLDPHARRDLWHILDQLRKDGLTLILTTHYMEEAEYLCQRIVILYQGKILADGAMDQLLSSHAAEQVIEFQLIDDLAPPENLEKLKGFKELYFEQRTQKWVLKVDSHFSTLKKFLSKVGQDNLRLLETRKKNLDDLFISMTGRHLSE